MSMSSYNCVGTQTIGVTCSFTGALGATVNAYLEFTKIGNMTFLSATDDSIIVQGAASAGATNMIFAAEAIPEGMRPVGATMLFFSTTVVDADIPTNGFFAATEDGGILVVNSLATDDYGTTGDNGFVTPSAFWRSQ